MKIKDKIMLARLQDLNSDRQESSGPSYLFWLSLGVAFFFTLKFFL